MRLHYIYHSCFAVEEEECLMVYDYWRDPAGRLAALLAEAEGREKEVFFLVSHFHEDHYNAQLPDRCMSHERWHLLPSYDTVKRRRIPPEAVLAVLRFGERVETPFFTLQAYRSTDVGVCTVAVLRDGTTLFHAGDCNNWYFPDAESDRVKTTPEQMEKLYLSILRDIRRDHPRIDHAMFPVDPRLGQEMLRGLQQFTAAIEVGQVHPMHYCLPREV